MDDAEGEQAADIVVEGVPPVERPERILIALVDVLACRILRNDACRRRIYSGEMPGIAVALTKGGKRIRQSGAVCDLGKGRSFVEDQAQIVARTRFEREVAEVGLGFPVVVGCLIVRLGWLDGIVGSASAEVQEVTEPARLLARGIFRAVGRSALPAQSEVAVVGVELTTLKRRAVERMEGTGPKVYVQDGRQFYSVFRRIAAGQHIEGLNHVRADGRPEAALQHARQRKAVYVEGGRGVLAARMRLVHGILNEARDRLQYLRQALGVCIIEIGRAS